MRRGLTTCSPSRTINRLFWPALKTCFRRIPPPQVLTIEDNRSRRERRSICLFPVTPEQVGLAGAQQLAKLQRTRTFTGPDFVADPIVNPQSLVAKLSAAQDPSTLALRSTLPAKVRKMLFGEAVGDLGTALALAKALNKLAKGPSLYNPERFPDQILSPKTLALKDQRLKGTRLAQFNRMLLCDAFPQEISTEPKTETIWLVTSLEPEKLRAEDFLLKNRQYWGIENGAHQRLDCSALEDRLRVRDTNAATVLGLFHRVSLTLFMAWAKKQPSVRDRTFPTWQALQAANRWNMIRQVARA